MRLRQHKHRAEVQVAPAGSEQLQLPVSASTCRSKRRRCKLYTWTLEELQVLSFRLIDEQRHVQTLQSFSGVISILNTLNWVTCSMFISVFAATVQRKKLLQRDRTMWWQENCGRWAHVWSDWRTPADLWPLTHEAMELQTAAKWGQKRTDLPLVETNEALCCCPVWVPDVPAADISAVLQNLDSHVQRKPPCPPTVPRLSPKYFLTFPSFFLHCMFIIPSRIFMLSSFDAFADFLCPPLYCVEFSCVDVKLWVLLKTVWLFLYSVCV